jgi:RNA polymerase sigma factor (sigma-70 family)
MKLKDAISTTVGQTTQSHVNNNGQTRPPSLLPDTSLCPDTGPEGGTRAITDDENQQLRDQHWDWMVAKAARFRVEDPELDASKAWHTAIRRYKPGLASFKTFLWRVLMNQLCSSYRQQIKKRALTQTIADDFEVVDQQECQRNSSRELDEIIDLAVSKLSSKDQQLFRLYYENELSAKEIADGI